jgi:uncharacterized damage-inducible protein DinB
MKRMICVAFVMSLPTMAYAQPAPAPQKVTLLIGVQRGYENIKRILKEAAQIMPDADYAYKPKAASRFAFAQIFGHIANSQFVSCSLLKGEPNPNEGINNENKANKAEFVKALNDSFTYCDGAFAAAKEETIADFVKQGPDQVARGMIMSNLVRHSNEHYGEASVYMRLRGLVPPSESGGPGNGLDSHIPKKVTPLKPKGTGGPK